MPYQTQRHTQLVLDHISRCPGWMPTGDTPDGAVMALYSLTVSGEVEYLPSLDGYAIVGPCRGRKAPRSQVQ